MVVVVVVVVVVEPIGLCLVFDLPFFTGPVEETEGDDEVELTGSSLFFVLEERLAVAGAADLGLFLS